MGERGADHGALPTDDEIARMGDLLEQALRAGALGFTTSRTIKHHAKDGRFTPSLSAREPELFGLAAAMKRAGRGVIEVNSDFGPGEFEILRAAAEVSGRPLSLLLLQVNNAPELWRETRAQIHAGAQGRARRQRPGRLPADRRDWGLETSINPFTTHPAWRTLSDLTPAQRYDRLMRDADLRRVLVEQRPDDEYTRFIDAALPMTYVVDETYDYEPDPSVDSIAAQARARGTDPWTFALDAMMQDGGKRLLSHTFENYTEGSLEVIREMLIDEATIMGLGDGGAHVCTICDCQLTYLSAHPLGPRPQARRQAADRVPGAQADAATARSPTACRIAVCSRRATGPTSTSSTSTSSSCSGPKSSTTCPPAASV